MERSESGLFHPENQRFTRRNFLRVATGLAIATAIPFSRSESASAAEPTTAELLANLTLFTSERTEERVGAVRYETVIAKNWQHFEGVGPEGYYEDAFTTDPSIADPDLLVRVYAPNKVVTAGLDLEEYTKTLIEGRLKASQARKWDMSNLPEIINRPADFQMDGNPTRELITEVSGVVAPDDPARRVVGRFVQLPDETIVHFEGEFSNDQAKFEKNIGPFEDMCRLVKFLDFHSDSV